MEEKIFKNESEYLVKIWTPKYKIVKVILLWE